MHAHTYTYTHTHTYTHIHAQPLFLVLHMAPHVCPTAILLGHLKLSHDKIKHAILACDTRMLSEQHLQQLETFAPDSKEVHPISEL